MHEEYALCFLNTVNLFQQMIIRKYENIKYDDKTNQEQSECLGLARLARHFA
jgi:hypothetical protein